MKDSINTRMKENYENRSKTFLTRRTPVIIRIDGKAFHTYTKGLKKPFDNKLIDDMIETTIFLFENVQGCKLGYTQSDEISLLITDYDTLQTDAWFDYSVQKICSISASLATAKFNSLRPNKLAFFDARCFNIPKEEVANYFIARQQDAIRNSIQALGQSLFSHKEIENKNISEIQEMCFQKGCNWNNFSTPEKQGSIIIKNEVIEILHNSKLNYEYFNKIVEL